MPFRQHTIIVVPPGGTRLKKIHLASWVLRLGLGSLALLTLAAGFSLWFVLSDQAETSQLSALSRENLELRQRNTAFEATARRLEEQLGRYEDRTEQLAIIAGIDTALAPLDDRAPSDVAGVGGSLNPGDVLPDLPSMMVRADLLETRIATIDERFEDRRLQFSSRPSVLPVRGVFSSGYGYRKDPITGERAFHRGIDLSATAGNEVRATADGVVVTAGTIGGLGRAVYLSHGFGFSTRYGHLAQINVEPGQAVKRGDVLGRVGRSGRATGYHVHYEVYENGRPRNPLEFILASSR